MNKTRRPRDPSRSTLEPLHEYRASNEINQMRFRVAANDQTKKNCYNRCSRPDLREMFSRQTRLLAWAYADEDSTTALMSPGHRVVVRSE